MPLFEEILEQKWVEGSGFGFRPTVQTWPHCYSLLIEAEGSVAANTNSKGEEKFSVKEYVLVSCLYY